MISKIKKPVSILLSLIMVFSVFAIVPLSASAASSYFDLARGTLIQPEDILSFEKIGSFKFADYDDPTIIHEVKGSDFSYNKATLSVTDGYYSFGSTKLLPTSVSPGGLLIADYDSTTKMATFGVQNITHSFDETTGTLTIGGSGVVPEHYAMTGTGASGVVFTQSNLVKHLIIDATDMIAIQNSAFMAYNGGCVLEDVKINSTSSTPLIIEEQAVFYRSGNTVTVTVNAVKLATVTKSPVKNYNTPVNLIYNVEQPITFKKNALTDPSRYLTVTFPTHCKILIPGGAQFTNSRLQEEYDELAEDGREELFWRLNPDLVEGTDYVLGDARYEELTPLNASLVVGNKNTALFSAYTITDESVNGTVTASVNGTDVTEAAADADVTLTVAPAEGYQFVSISAGDVSLTTVTEGSQYSLTMPRKFITVTAEFEAIPTYTVTWKNGETVLETDENVKEGTIPEYNGTTPVKDEDGDYIYTFAGWSPEVSAVTGDVTYTAQFDANPKSGSFDGLNWSIDEDGVLTFSGSGAIPAEAFKFNPFIKKVIINDSVTKVGANAFADCTNLTELTFDSETPISFANGEYTYLTDTVTVNVPAGSTYQYTVQVSTLATEKTAYKDVLPTLQAEFKKEVAWGTNYEEALAIVLENYADWVQQQTGEYPIADEFEFVLEDEERTGNIADGQKYASVFGGANVHVMVYTYTVTWKNGETVLETDENVAQGTIPEYNGTTPVKDEDDDFTYTFAGWSPEIAAVTGDVEYTATFDATAKYEAGYYVVGTMNNWAIDPAYKLAENPAVEGEYMLNDLALTASDEIKIIYAEPGEGKKWYPEGMDNNMSFSTDGSYNIYFRPDGQGGDDWYNGLIFAERCVPAESTEVINAINALPDAESVTLADAEQIEAARAAFEALTDEQKDYIDTDTLNKLTDAETALFGLKYDAFGEYRSNQADNFYIAMDQKIGTDDDELRNALNDAISAIENVSYDPNKSLDENKAAADAVVQAQTEVMNNKITEVCNAYKAQKIAQVQGLAQDGDPDPVYMEIEIIADRINGEMFEDTNVSSFKSRIDYHVEQAQEQISFAREQAFGNYKIDKAYDVRSLTQAGDSEAVLQIIDNAVQAINAVSYDTSKTYVENKAAVDAAADITLLEQQVIAQRNAEKAAAVTAQINALPADVTVNDKDQIEAARAAYDALTDDQKALVTNETLDKLTDAEEAFAKARDDKAAADTVIDQINALPTDITLADAEQINAARNAYEALTDDQKNLIDSETLNKLTDAETALTEAVDQDAADAVDDKIDSLPAEITLDDKADVEAARAAFDALSDDQKALIDDETIAKLTAAEQTIANIEAANAVTDQINALPAEITLDNKASVEAARQVYDALTDDQKALIDDETLNKLTAAETVIADREAAKAVEDQINALPDQITPENKQTFMDVSSAFIRLSHDQEEYLSVEAMNKVNNVLLANYFVTGADQLPEEITPDDKQSVTELRSYYDDASDDVKALISDEYMNKLVSAEKAIADLEAVKAVEDMIKALPAVEDITLNDKDAVNATYDAFGALTDDQVFLLDGDLFDDLLDALDKIQDLEAAKVVEDKINALPDVILLEDKADVEAARAAYDALEPEQKDLIDLSVVEKLEDAEEVIADREAAKAVEDMISALPAVEEITLADKAAVEAANEARLNLTPAQADYLTFSAIDTLFKALDKISDLEAAQDVDNVIDALPEVDDITLDDKDAVEAARDFYDGLDDTAKAFVGDDTLDKLEAAEKKIADLQAAADVEEMITELPDKDDVTVADTGEIIAARAAYNALTDDQKAMVDKDTLDKLTAAETAVINALTDAFTAAQISTQINKLPETVVAGDKDDIEAARAAYDALTDAQKALVDDETVQKLLDAEEALEQALADKAAADAVSEQINALPDELTPENKDDIEAAKAAYDALTDAQKAYVDEATMQKLTDAEEYLDSLVMLGDFDGDGEVTIIDVTLMQRYDVLLREYSEKQFKAADVDGDGDVTVIDVTFIQRYLSNIPVRFPIGEYVA